MSARVLLGPLVVHFLLHASDGVKAFCDEEPPREVLTFFKKRGGNQIMSLELLSIAYGISTFAEQLQGKNVVIFSGNTGAEAALAKGEHWGVHVCLVSAL